MNELLHVLGLCPDSMSHLDLLDLATANQTTIVHILNFFTKK